MNDPTAAPITLAGPVRPQVEPHTHGGVSVSEAATLAKWTREYLAVGKITS